MKYCPLFALILFPMEAESWL